MKLQLQLNSTDYTTQYTVHHQIRAATVQRE